MKRLRILPGKFSVGGIAFKGTVGIKSKAMTPDFDSYDRCVSVRPTSDNKLWLVVIHRAQEMLWPSAIVRLETQPSGFQR